MKIRQSMINFIFSIFIIFQAIAAELPVGFIDIKDIDPSIKISLRYCGFDNFLGRPVKGYLAERLILSKEAAEALKAVQTELKTYGLSLLIYDGYRPQIAIDDFLTWSEDVGDNKMKEWFYPELSKSTLLAQEYVSTISKHSSGNAVDITLIRLEEQPKTPDYTFRKLIDDRIIPYIDDGSIDMGSSYDFFDVASHSDYSLISYGAAKNREFLRKIMAKYGFVNYHKEWWHFTLQNHLLDEQRFNFPIE